MRQLVEKADTLEDAGLLKESLDVWRQVVAREATAVSLCRLGSLATRLKQWGEAEKALLAAVEAAPKWPLAYEVLGLLYRDRGDLETALKFFRGSLHQERTERALTFIGDVLSRLGRPTDARKAFAEAIELDPSYEEAYFGLAQVTGDDPGRAIAFYQRAISLDPNYALAYRELGWTLRKLRRLPEAAAHVRKALELDDQDAWAEIYLGNILWTQMDIREAGAAFRRAIALDGQCSVACWCLGDLLKSEGRTSEARQLFRQSVRLNVGSAQANLRFALFLHDAGEHRRAKKYFRRVLHLDPANALARSLAAADSGSEPQPI